MTEAGRKFAAVSTALAGDRRVTQGDGKGFGASALKASGRIFAMLASRERFVVKLPKARVDALTAEGLGERYDPGHGRIMKEWLVVASPGANWIELAREALRFAAGEG